MNKVSYNILVCLKQPNEFREEKKKRVTIQKITAFPRFPFSPEEKLPPPLPSELTTMAMPMPQTFQAVTSGLAPGLMFTSPILSSPI